MKRLLAAAALALSFAATAAGQTNVESAREEMRRGGEQYRAGDYAEAQRHFERAVGLDPSFRYGPLLVARALLQQFKPGVSTPENLAKGREALAVYEKFHAADPGDEEAFNAVVYLYRRLEDEEGERGWLWRLAQDASAPAARRAVAYIILAGREWDCSHEITEANRTVSTRGGEPSARYVRPKSRADMDRARGCAAEGLSLVDEAARLDASNRNVWSQKANLLREQSKLAEMEGDARLKDHFERLVGVALETYNRLTADDEKKKRAGAKAEEGVAPPASSRPASGPRTRTRRAP